MGVTSLIIMGWWGGGGAEVGVGEYGVAWGPKLLFRSLIFLDIKLHVKGIGLGNVIRLQ